MKTLQRKSITDPFASRQWLLAHGRTLETGPAAILVGIVNVTPDSFSDGGQHFDENKAIEHALKMAAQGAAMIDIGGESSRPGAEPVSPQTERKRIVKVLQGVAGRSEVLISVDTWRASTASAAIEAGAHAINDIWGLQKDSQLAKVVADSGAGIIAMHSGRDRERDRNVIADQLQYLGASLGIAERSGIDPRQIVLDPGFGFAKAHDENFELLARLQGLHELGYPVMVGTSRKRFVGHATSREVGERDVATAATSAIARMKGAALFRVHDVAANRDALAIADAVLMADRLAHEEPHG